MAFKKYNKIRRPGHTETDGLFADNGDRLIITEKFDGNNFRFQRDGDAFRFGSRNVDLGTDLSEIGGMFDDVASHIDDTVSVDVVRDLEDQWGSKFSGDVDPSFVFFGENAVQHTIDEYNWERVPQFQLFDVWVDYGDDNGEWLPWDSTKDHTVEPYTVEGVAHRLGLETVPVISKTTVSEFLDEYDLSEFTVPESYYREDGGQAEGVVFRNEQTGVKAKYISESFAERHQSAKSSNLDDTDAEFDHYQFLDTHVTDRRIEKNIAKLIEEPDNDYEDLEMRMMADLHLKVWFDVWSEDYEEIIQKNWVLDLDQLHNASASKCARFLEDLIQSGEKPVAIVDPESGRVVGEELEEVEA